MKFKFYNFLLLLLVFTSSLSFSKSVPKSSLNSYKKIDKEALSYFEKILIQNGGRIKPIYTLSRFSLMSLNGKSSVTFQTKDNKKHKISSSEWLLVSLFLPEISKKIPVFQVDDSDAIIQINVSPKKKKDFYSYDELSSGIKTLHQLGLNYHKRKDDPANEFTSVENILINLHQNILRFESYINQFNFARRGQYQSLSVTLPDYIKKLEQNFNISSIVKFIPEMNKQMLEKIFYTRLNDESPKINDFYNRVRLLFYYASSNPYKIKIFPPKEQSEENWLSISDLILYSVNNKEIRNWAIENLDKLTKIIDSSLKINTNLSESINLSNYGVFESEIINFSKSQNSDLLKLNLNRAIKKSKLELQIYKGRVFYYPIVIFTFALLATILSWLFTGSKLGYFLLISSVILSIIAFILSSYGITLRCIIRDRPPVTNLYDTILFISVVSVLLGLILEYITKLGIGNFISVFSGLFGILLALKYEAKEATDTMTQLQAVLNTNFWLATHVIIITIGYAAGLVAGIIAIYYISYYIILKFRKLEGNKKYLKKLKTLTKMNYGIICFCLFFSLVGTILGGIWANYSWGRFWGWDPKENGALMICLWTLVILHARMAGWLKSLGIHIMSIILTIIVTFSWWGVNNLGTGLHSYGFTDGIWGALYISWGILGLFMALGVIIWNLNLKKKGNYN